MSGQINRGSRFGEKLFEIASDPQYNIFVDVGSWNGLGTTKILVDATRKNMIAQIYSVEANAAMFEVAKKNWVPCPGRLRLLWGRIASRMMSQKEVLEHPFLPLVRPHYDIYWDQDCSDFAAAPIVELPIYADVVILDGGEFCGDGDLDRALSLRPKIIAMDDTHVIKNSGPLRRLLASGEWRILARGEDKNGWAILRRASSIEVYTEMGF
jgi:hypothetical protein